MLMNQDEVKKILPHRDPFLFINTVESITIPGIPDNKKVEKSNIVGAEVKAHYYVSKELDLFKGHFPNRPIFPGVIQIEAMAQASCFAVCRYYEDPYTAQYQVALLKIEESKFRKPVFPDTHLTIISTCLKIRRQFMTHSCQIYHKDDLISEAKIFASLVETKN